MRSWGQFEMLDRCVRSSGATSSIGLPAIGRREVLIFSMRCPDQIEKRSDRLKDLTARFFVSIEVHRDAQTLESTMPKSR
jgi:hypothetical protein